MIHRSSLIQHSNASAKHQTGKVRKIYVFNWKRAACAIEFHAAQEAKAGLSGEHWERSNHPILHAGQPLQQTAMKDFNAYEYRSRDGSMLHKAPQPFSLWSNDPNVFPTLRLENTVELPCYEPLCTDLPDWAITQFLADFWPRSARSILEARNTYARVLRPRATRSF